MITGGGGKGLDFLSIFGFWVSFLFFATKLSIELFTLVKFSIKKKSQVKKTSKDRPPTWQTWIDNLSLGGYSGIKRWRGVNEEKLLNPIIVLLALNQTPQKSSQLEPRAWTKKKQFFLSIKSI